MRMPQLLKRLGRTIAGRQRYRFILKDWIALKDLSVLSTALESKRFSANLQPLVVSRLEARRALILAPHPDDDILSSGGTLLKLKENSASIKTVCMTSSDILEKEARKVSGALGSEIEFWRYTKRRIPIDKDSKERMRALLATYNPDSVFLPFIADDHDDHRRTTHLFYETFKNERSVDFEVWAFQVYSTLIPNVVVDITGVMEEKLRLVGLYDSIKESRDWQHYIRGLDAFNSRFLKTNKPLYAETFFVVPAREYLEFCAKYFESPQENLYYSAFYKGERL